jgi:hypothetical protein
MTPLVMSNEFDAYVIRKETPDGTLFVTIDHYKNTKKIAQIRAFIGKSGSKLNAWTFACSQLITLALAKGATIEDLITLLSNTNSDRLVYDGNVPITSGPAGLVQALIAYNHERYREVQSDIDRINKKRGRAKLYGRSARL